MTKGKKHRFYQINLGLLYGVQSMAVTAAKESPTLVPSLKARGPCKNKEGRIRFTKLGTKQWREQGESPNSR